MKHRTKEGWQSPKEDPERIQSHRPDAIKLALIEIARKFLEGRNLLDSTTTLEVVMRTPKKKMPLQYTFMIFHRGKSIFKSEATVSATANAQVPGTYFLPKISTVFEKFEKASKPKNLFSLFF